MFNSSENNVNGINAAYAEQKQSHYVQNPYQYQTNEMQAMGQMVASVNQVGNAIIMHSDLLSQTVNNQMEQFRRENRKQRKRKIATHMLEVEPGLWGIAYEYDDRTIEVKQISSQNVGKYHVYNLELGIQDKRMLYAILFENNLLVIGNVNAITGRKLYDTFLAAGFPLGTIKANADTYSAFQKYWMPRISQTHQVLEIQRLAGWDREKGEFMHRENYLLRKQPVLQELPIFNKSFEIEDMSEERQNLYFTALNQLQSKEDRIIIALFPFAALLSSILSEEGYIIPIFLNLVMIENVEIKTLCALFQVFNRKKLSPIRMDLHKKDIEKLLMNSQDEVLILDARSNEYDSNYQKNLRRRNAMQIVDICTGKSSQLNCMNEDINCGSVVLNSEQEFASNTKNIFVDSDFCDDLGKLQELHSNGVMEAVLSSFVSFSERNMEWIRNTIRKERVDTIKNAQVFERIFEILQGFWLEQGVELCMALELPQRLEWEKILDTHEENPEELILLFVQGIRKAVSSFYMVEKQTTLGIDNKSIYYDSEFLWFPTNVFLCLMDDIGMRQQKTKIVAELRKEGYLKTDTEGSTRKLQIHGERFECYQIYRKLFDVPGRVQIVDLGKESSNVVR